MDEAEAVALYFEDMDVGQDPDRANEQATKREDKSGQDSLKSFGKEMSKGLGELAHGITESMSKPTLSLTKNGTGLPVGGGQAQSNKPYNNPITCFDCGEKGHMQSQCPKPRQRPAQQNYAGQVNAYQPPYAPQPYPLPPSRYPCPPQQYPYGAQQQAYAPQVYPAIGAARPQGYRPNNLMSRVGQPTTNLWTAVTPNEAMVYPKAEIYAGAATRGPHAPVPFSPEAVNNRRVTEQGRRANIDPDSGARQPEMPTIPAARSRGAFDILAQMQALPVKIDVLTYLQIAPEAREQLMKRMEEMGPHGSRGPARASASAAANRPAARVPFPAFPAARPTAANPPAPQQGAVPMEHMMDTEEAYLTEMPRSLNTVVKAQVLIGGQPFEGILHTVASDSAISMDVVRRLGLLDRMTPSDITFLTAGGSSERPEGVLMALPIRIGRLELKIDTMVTPAQNYNILVGNDWLCMAGADLLLSKSILRIRLCAEQWEDVPIDAEMTPRRLNTLLRQVPSTSQTPQQAILAAAARGS